MWDNSIWRSLSSGAFVRLAAGGSDEMCFERKRRSGHHRGPSPSGQRPNGCLMQLASPYNVDRDIRRKGAHTPTFAGFCDGHFGYNLQFSADSNADPQAYNNTAMAYTQATQGGTATDRQTYLQNDRQPCRFRPTW